jgi:hypothetical protein
MTAGAPQLTADRPPSEMALAALGQYFADCERPVTVSGLDLGWAEEMKLTAEERQAIDASSVDVLDRLEKTDKALRRKRAQS